MNLLYKGKEYYVVFDKYSNSNVCIKLVSKNNFCHLVVSLNIVKLPQYYVAIKIDNENEDIGKALINAEVLEYLVTTIPIEGREVPIYKLSIYAIQKLIS